MKKTKNYELIPNIQTMLEKTEKLLPAQAAALASSPNLGFDRAFWVSVRAEGFFSARSTSSPLATKWDSPGWMRLTRFFTKHATLGSDPSSCAIFRAKSPFS